MHFHCHPPPPLSLSLSLFGCTLNIYERAPSLYLIDEFSLLAKVSSGAGAGGKGGYWAHVKFYTMWRATNCCALNDCCCCGCCRCHGRIQLCRQMRLATSANKPKSTQRQARLTPPPLSPTLSVSLPPTAPLSNHP